MGFDAVDKRFRREEIKLECECCGQVPRSVKSRELASGAKSILCSDCYSQVLEHEAG